MLHFAESLDFILDFTFLAQKTFHLKHIYYGSHKRMNQLDRYPRFRLVLGSSIS